jgi:hypothetical protein
MNSFMDEHRGYTVSWYHRMNSVSDCENMLKHVAIDIPFHRDFYSSAMDSFVDILKIASRRESFR